MKSGSVKLSRISLDSTFGLKIRSVAVTEYSLEPVQKNSEYKDHFTSQPTVSRLNM